MNTRLALLVAGCLSLGAPILAQEPQLLFNGISFDGWMTTNGDPVEGGWVVEDGAIRLDASQDRGGNIVTTDEYSDFILDFEWKIASGGNSGIKYKVRRFGPRTLGCEYQLIDDDVHLDGRAGKTSTGSLYHLYAPNSNKYLFPVGEFNRSRIVVCANHLEHWLNGQLIVSADVGTEQWWENKADSKFAGTEGFGENRYGRIMLTDHNSDVWYRNLQLTPLVGCWANQYQTMTAIRCPKPRRFLRFRRRR